jgi:hypothetical protein
MLTKNKNEDAFAFDFLQLHLQQSSNITSHKAVEIKLFSIFLLADGKIRIRCSTVQIFTDPDPGDPKTSEHCYEYYFKAFLSYLARNMRFRMYCLSSPTLCPVTFTISASFAMENRQFSALNGTRRKFRAPTVTRGKFSALNGQEESSGP